MLTLRPLKENGQWLSLIHISCTEAQRRRFLLYALEGLSLAEIGVLCGCSKVAVYQSVEAVRKKFINFFENRLNE